MPQRLRTLLPLAVLLSGSLLLLGSVSSPQRSARAQEKPAPLKPLKIDRSAPLLLPSAAPAPQPDPWDGPVGPLADNSSCFVCHGNYSEEELATTHAKSNVGCIKCHGESLAHRNDENNTTPPDTMYPASAIDSACLDCHDDHDASARDVLARWRERCPEKTDPATVVCTDCHGHHRLTRRTVRWNKETKELILEDAPSGEMR